MANNNVVIIEPIRTKIEKMSGKLSDTQRINCKITAGAPKSHDTANKSVVNRHFFYHPIRVNKELLEEELPTPDTVRNARRVFEETLCLRAGTGAGHRGTIMKTIDEHQFNGKINENLRKKALRYLTIDTSATKWDSASMSSGVSSGELSSPCEYNEREERKESFSSTEENMCNDDMCESHFVSQVCTTTNSMNSVFSQFLLSGCFGKNS